MLPRFLVALWDANSWPNQFLEHSQGPSQVSRRRTDGINREVFFYVDAIRTFVNQNDCLRPNPNVSLLPPWPGTCVGTTTLSAQSLDESFEWQWWISGYHLWVWSSRVFPCRQYIIFITALQNIRRHIKLQVTCGLGIRRVADISHGWDGRCDQGGMVLAASDGRCWHLIWDGSCWLTIIPGLWLVTHPETRTTHWPELVTQGGRRPSDTDQDNRVHRALNKAHHMSRYKCSVI